MKIIGKTQKELDQEKNIKNLEIERKELIEKLNSTDWYITREFDTGKVTPTDIKEQRNYYRSRISEINNIINGVFE